MRHVLLFVERILHLCFVLHLLVLRSIGAVTSHEEVGRKVTCRLQRCLITPSVHIVVGNNGIERDEVNLVGLRCQLNGVFHYSGEEELPETAEVLVDLID